MKALANILTGLVALSHIGFLVLEMFFWDHPVGRRIFGMTPEVSASSAVLAANQGLYNGFLAAGLLWALWTDRPELKIFFLGCVVVAGVFGSMTAKGSILFTQALPAAMALLLVLVAPAAWCPVKPHALPSDRSALRSVGHDRDVLGLHTEFT